MNHDVASMAQLASLASNSPTSQNSPHHGQQESSNSKRNNEDGLPQQRAKRNRYISIACNECKRRKIKCNGNAPCQRCGNLSHDCVYAPNCCSNGFKESKEYNDMSDQIASLQDQVTALYDNLNNLRAELGHGGGLQQPPQMQQQHAIDPTLQQSQYAPSRQSFDGQQSAAGAPIAPMSSSHTLNSSLSQQQPSFRGPTSSAFNFSVAKSSLQIMGITGGEGNNSDSVVTADATPSDSPPRHNASLHRDKDPIWSIQKDEALRLCGLYEDEMGLMYPILDISKTIGHATKLYQFMESAARNLLIQGNFPGADAIEDDDTNILKLVMAIAMTVEGAGRSEVGRRLFEYVQPTIDALMLGSVGIKGIQLLTLTAMYEFHRDNEGTSWRVIGLTARLCIEFGLHRRETYDIMESGDREQAILLFWAIYVLDRRWSFGTGMPFALQDADFDPSLPKPEEKSPYLSAMISYSSIGSKVWRTVATTPGPSAPPINTGEIRSLDYQIIEWHKRIPADLCFEHPGNGMQSTPALSPASRALHRLRALLYLRANQMRILIYRPLLHSATSIVEHRDDAQAVVDVAKDTIRVLTHIDQTTDIYRSQQMLFNAFLTSALAVFFLAVGHMPILFAEQVREEFYMALALVRGLSRGSWVSKRLWKTIRVLKEVGPRLGLRAINNANAMQQDQDKSADLDPSRSAAVAMAGLAGHNVDEIALYGSNPQEWVADTGTSSSPDGMANDLTSLFEAAGGYAALGNHSMGSGAMNGNASGAAYAMQPLEMEGMAGMYGGDDGLSNILKDLF